MAVFGRNMRKIPRRTRKSISIQSAALTELMEQRFLLSSVVSSAQSDSTPIDNMIILRQGMSSPLGYSSPSGAPITPNDMREAYGLGIYNSSSVTFNGVQGTGAGQTIALIEGGSDPDIAADLTAFDSYWGLPAPPSLNQYNATGGTTLPAVGDVGELDLDVEWAHVMAPQASLVLFDGSLYTGMTTAADWPGVSVISVSYGISGTEGVSEFETPTGHNGVTFFGAAGDSAGDVFDPSKSPAVVSVGGTALTVANNAWSSETGWSASGGGVNTAENQPTYQSGIVSAYSTQYRVEPDVGMDSDPSTGVAVYDEYDNGTTDPWSAIVGGTSLGTPLMAGIVAVADQGRVAEGLTSLDGYTQTLPRLYQIYTANAASNFHQIAVNNGTPVYGSGYNENAGLGSPIANNLIPDLAGGDTITGQAFIDNNDNGVYDSGVDTPLANKTVYLDLYNNGVQEPTDPTATTNSSGGYTFTDVIGSWTGKVRLAGASGYATENNTTLTTAYDSSQTYNLVFSAATTYTATATPSTVTASNTSLGVTISGTAAPNLTYTWAATTVPTGATPVFSANGTAAAQNTTVTLNEAGTYVFTVTAANSTGQSVTSSVTVTVNQTATSIAITPVSPNLTGGTTQQMTATEYDQFGYAMATQPTNFVWSISSGNGSINSSTGIYTAPSSGTLATVKATVSTFSATDQVYVVSTPWASADIGSPSAAGTAFDTSGVFNISSASSGISGTSDQFHYVYRALGGDGSIVADVTSQSNSNASAGAGVMIRSSLAANAQQVLMGLTPSSGAIFESRTTVGGSTTSSKVTGITAPYWVKLVRSGNTITGYYSTNGSTWTLDSSTTVYMTGSIYIGLYDTSNTTATASTVTIGSVSLMDATNDTITASAGSPGSVNVLTNDVGPTGTTLTVASVTQGSYGTVTIGSGGVITYTTSLTTAGTDSFTYTISDGIGDTATATVSVTILGLEAYYKFSEGTGTTTADSSGNGNTATITSATWTTGVAGDGLAFNGSSNYVTGPTLNISSAAMTFTGWVDSTGTQTSDAGLIFNRNGSIANGLDMYSGTKLGYSWGTAAGTYDFSNGPALPTGTWTFVALVISSTSATIYMQPLGGTLTSVTNTLANAVETFSTPILVGEDSESSSRCFKGSMDEVRIYDTNLSISAITALGETSSFLTAVPATVSAYAGSPGTVNVFTNDAGPNGSTLAITGFTNGSSGTVVYNGNGSFTYSTSDLIQGTDSFTYTLSDGLGDTTTGMVNVSILGMIAYYQMNEGSGLSTADATGDGYTGTLNNTTWTTGLTGLSTDHALSFNGTSSDVTFANSPSLSGTTNFTVAAWIKTTSTAGEVIIQQRDANGFNGEYQLAVNGNGTVTFYLYNDGYQFDITTTKTVNNGSWQQITAVRNGSAGTIYINGVSNATGSGTPLDLTSTITVAIGADIRDSGGYFKGTMDNVMIFDVAVTPSALTTISTLGPIVTTAAAVSPAPVTSTTAAFSVAGSDYYESSTPLTYTWSVTTVPSGAQTPAFSANSNASASSNTVTFYKAGSYVFKVTLTDQSGLTATSTVDVTVSQTPTSVTLSASSIESGGTVQATAYDQFGNALSPAPTWSATGGTITTAGVYTAGSTGGSYTITATSGSYQASAGVAVTPTSYNGSTGNDTYAIRLSPSNPAIEQIFVNTPETSTPTYTVAISNLSSLTFTTANDGSLTVDFTNGNPLPSAGINYSGGSVLSIIGAAAGGMSFTINGTQVVDAAAASSPIVYSSVASVVFNLSGGSNALTQSAQPAAAVIYDAGTLSNSLTVNGGAFTFSSDPQLTSGSLTVNDNSSVIFTAPVAGSGYDARNLAALNLGSSATATVTASTTATDRTVLELGQLSITTGGTLDLANNAMIVHNGNIQTINSLIKKGLNQPSGFWNGTGIISSTARANTTYLTSLGSILNGSTYPTTFDSQNVVSTDVLVKYTYYGDANLDGGVDGSDYTKIDNGFNSKLTGWANGDFNYDSLVDGSDYTLIDNAYNKQSTAHFAEQIAAPAAQIVLSKLTAGKSSAARPVANANLFQLQNLISIPPAQAGIEALLLKRDVLDKLAVS
jgi:hypothetical protein